MSRATTGEVSPAEQGAFLVHLSRARKHLQEERYDVARQELDLAALARPTDEDVLNLLSVIEFKRGYYNEAARACRMLLKNNSGSAVLHSNLGLILFKAGVLVEAEQELRRALELQPDHVRSHLYLGLLYRLRGKLGLALEHLRYAGAKRVVVEIEEALRRNVRDPGSRPSARRTAAAAAAVAPPLKLAERLTPPPPP
ncbi:MAG: tetratricopeptide repeat protein, partial [Acidobacteriota bacterium]|nr:tetratricopeptide repeat protein [Acidobacteriota bacterium]